MVNGIMKQNDKNSPEVKLAKTLIKNKNMLMIDDLRADAQRRTSHGNIKSRLQISARKSSCFILPTVVSDRKK